jgi:hypothetical protein
MDNDKNPSRDIVSEDVVPKERSPLWRLFVEEEGVASNGWFSVYREDPGHQLANILRLICLLCISPIYFVYYFVKRLTPRFNFLRSSWSIESIKVIHAILSRPPGSNSGGENPYVPGQFKPRWMIKVTFKSPTSRERDLQVIAWNANSSKSYTALSYSYQDAQDLMAEKYSNTTTGGSTTRETFKKDPLMTAWRQAVGDANEITHERWQKIDIRQRNARVFLDCYLDARAAQRGKVAALENTEYVWLDEFCLYPVDAPSLRTRDEELGRMADIFGFASAVCVYCPRTGCSHVNRDCSWGGRLWTLSEIVHTENIISLTRNGQSDDPSLPDYSLVPVSGRHFRSEIQRAAELEGQWHLHAIMRHANNSGSTTWQHSIHSMVVEAIMRNEKSNETNKFLAKALNGLLPRRARPQDLLGDDGWTDLAWLLELNQGFYNSASLAAVCGLGEKTQASSGWLGPPIYPSAGNERLEPLVTAFPIPTGLFIMNPRVIGLRPSLKRDFKGLFCSKEHRLLQVCIHFLTRPVFDKARPVSGNNFTVFPYPSYRYTQWHQPACRVTILELPGLLELPELLELLKLPWLLELHELA